MKNLKTNYRTKGEKNTNTTNEKSKGIKKGTMRKLKASSEEKQSTNTMTRKVKIRFKKLAIQSQNKNPNTGHT